MKKLIRFLLTSSRKRRCLSVRIILWILTMLRDAEEHEVWRCSDLLDSFDSGAGNVHKYNFYAVEDEYLSAENACGFLDCAIDDLNFAY